MMLGIIGFCLGAAFGALRAKRLGGGLADMAQYGAGFGIFLGLTGLIASLILFRLYQ